jgi:hypothetical protein
MYGFQKMRTVKGRGIGEESVIGELIKYKKYGSQFKKKAMIAYLDTDECDFEMLFEVSQEFMGFVRVGKYDKNIADTAEELGLVGLFTEDERRINEAINETMIIVPQKSRAIIAPDIWALAKFESAMLDINKESESLMSEFFMTTEKKF